MVVDTTERFEKTKKLGFTIYGVGSRFRRRAQRMQPNDQVLFYVSSIKKWAALARIKSGYYVDQSPIWEPGVSGEVYPYRVKLEPIIVLDEDDYIDALVLAPRLEYVKRWPPEDWPLAFWDSLHLLPQKDFRLIEGEMKRLVKGKVTPKRRENKRRPGSRHHRRPASDAPVETNNDSNQPDQSAGDASFNESI